MQNLKRFSRRPIYGLLKYCFSTVSYDPYYVLGVEKGTPYDEIKKKYYKLGKISVKNILTPLSCRISP
jgi:hypothetical protein